MANAVSKKCPVKGCRSTATGMKEVRQVFGTRRNSRMEVIPQSYCFKCRKKNRDAAKEAPVKEKPKQKAAVVKPVKTVKAAKPKVQKAKAPAVKAPETTQQIDMKALYKEHYPNDKQVRGAKFMQAKLSRKGIFTVESTPAEASPLHEAVEESRGSVDFI